MNACMMYFMCLILKEVFHFSTWPLAFLVSRTSFSYGNRTACSSSFPKSLVELLQSTSPKLLLHVWTNWPEWQKNRTSDFKPPQRQRWQIPHKNKYHSANVRFALGLILYKYWVPRRGGGGDWTLPPRWQISRRVCLSRPTRQSLFEVWLRVH